MATATVAPELATGHLLVVRYETSNGRRSFESGLRAVLGDRLHITPPASSDDIYPGKQVEVLIDVSGAAYQFVSQVLALDEGDCILAYPNRFRLIEKRQHYRLQSGIVPTYAALTDANGIDDRTVRITVVDISAGGLQVVARTPFAKGLRIHMWLPIDDYRLDCAVEVMDFRPPGKGRSNYRYNCEFTWIRKDDRERLARFIFRKQLELRRRS